MPALDRRRFLQLSAMAAAPLFPAPYARLAAAQRRKVKITDVKCMIVRGTWDWNLVKIETDAGLYGIGEAYWGAGVKDVIGKLFKPLLIGEDPLNVDKLYTKMLMRNGGAGAIGGVTVEAASGVEIALWDLAGRILETPTVNLLGGRFRDRVRFYRTMQLPKQHVEDAAAWRDLVQQARAERWGWTAFKFQGDGIPRALDPQNQTPGHDPYTRQLKAGDIRQIVRLMEVVREELGPDGNSPSTCIGVSIRAMPSTWPRRWRKCGRCGWRIRCRRRMRRRWRWCGGSRRCRSARGRIFIRGRGF